MTWIQLCIRRVLPFAGRIVAEATSVGQTSAREFCLGAGGTMEPDVAELRRCIARACRILALQGLAEDVLGHVSVRLGADRLLIRCRGPHERGLLFTTPDDVHAVPLAGGPADLPGGYVVPSELPIHAEVLGRRPDVQAVA